MISIIIPVYKAERYLERCIKSILSQTEKDYELILVDDGSPDMSGDICDYWGNLDGRITVIHKENGGVSSARNAGLKIARGEFITFVDSDDWLDEKFLSALLQDLRIHNAQIGCCGYYKNTDDEEIRMDYFSDAVLSKEEALDCFSQYYKTGIGGKIFSSAVLNGNYFREDIFYSEDTLFYTKAVLNSTNICWTSCPLYHYYENADSASSNRIPERYYTDFLARREIINLYEPYPNLLEGAIVRCMMSVITLKGMESYQGIIRTEYQKVLSEFIAANKRVCFRSNYLNRKDKIKILVYGNTFGTTVYRLIVWMKRLRCGE